MAKRASLSTTVAQALAQDIENGKLQPGDKLPTEAELCEKFEVSRTVIREAVAQLRSDGLLIPRQGIGVFVSSEPPTPRFEINEVSLQTVREIIELLELRMGIEIESAGLCAARRSEEEAVEIRRLMEMFDDQHSDPGDVSVHYDYDFHLAIAKATKNAHMYKFLAFLKPAIVPRLRLNKLVADDYKEVFYQDAHNEHEAIVRAIEAQDADSARANMRIHLLNSLERFKRLAHSLGLTEMKGAEGGDSPQQLDSNVLDR